MSSYQKFTLATFKQRLNAGEYANSTGANRAIGKTKELSDAEKNSARALVFKYFGDEAPAKKGKKKTAKPAKKAKKATRAEKKEAKVDKAVKKIVKRATKKAMKEAAPRGRAKKAGKKVGKKAGKKAKRSEEPAPAEGKAPRKTRAAAAPEDSNEKLIELMGSVINTVGTALKSMESAKELFPKADLEQGVQSATTSMSKAVRILDARVLAPMDSEKTAAPAEKRRKGSSSKKASPSNGASHDDSSKKVTEQEAVAEL